jgi:Domain of unknown function (DUF4405)
MKRVHLNAVVDAVALVAFMGLASTGLVLRYQLPPGSGGAVGRGTGRGSLGRSVELLWGQTRHEWGDYHYWIALGLLAVLSVHLLLHWKWIVCVVRGQKSDASGWRLAVGLVALVMVTLAVSLPLYVSTNTTTRGELQQQRVDQIDPGSKSR